MKVIPKISIIMATFNRAQFIIESLKSIQEQTFKDWECIIIDDGSTDNTKEVLEEILVSDTRFNYYKRTDNYQKGLPGSRNYGLDIAQGDYIIFYDDDDIAHPQNLEICFNELSSKPIAFCRYIREIFTDTFDYNFDYSKTYTSFYIDRSDINSMLKNELPFNSCAVMWTKDCYATHRYTEHLRYAEEWEVYARILTSVNKGLSINKTLYYGRKHESSITGDFGKMKASSLASNADAIQLVLENLKNKGLINFEIVRYFVQVALKYKEYDLFNRILTTLNLSKFERFKWKLFYGTLPFRLYLYKYKKWYFK